MVDFERALSELAEIRPVFHSEADLQHALAWRLREQYPNARFRLERPCSGNRGRIYLDLWIRSEAKTWGVELKYKTRRLHVDIGGESFRLRNQSAQDIARYDFLADLERIEGLLEANVVDHGVAIFLTNDGSYWRDSGRQDRADEAFRIHERRVLSGQLAWSAHASDGTKRNRERPLLLKGSYSMNWKCYSRVGDVEFKYAPVNVRPPDP